jgi:hypothetical protein
MALRVYRDSAGDEWRVWRVLPDTASFATLDQHYREGWLCFERLDGTDRRRLSIALAPAAWETMPESALDQLRLGAEPAVARDAAASRAGVSTKADAPRARRRG